MTFEEKLEERFNSFNHWLNHTEEGEVAADSARAAAVEILETFEDRQHGELLALLACLTASVLYYGNDSDKREALIDAGVLGRYIVTALSRLPELSVDKSKMI